MYNAWSSNLIAYIHILLMYYHEVWKRSEVVEIVNYMTSYIYLLNTQQMM